MTTAFYARLAGMNIKNNRRIYLPYILTCAGMAAMFYIVTFLGIDREVGTTVGGQTLQTILRLGMGVVAVFAAIFLFYTNSFVMKRRKMELGLYNVLGMGKRHIARVMVLETGFVALVSLALGLLSGILMSKLGQMVMLKLVGKVASFDFTVLGVAVLATAVLFAAVFFLILLNSLWQVRAASPIELLRGGSAGEREPKANYVLAALGAALLGAGYWLALSVTNPIDALVWFFVAVILVILGTYLLFVSGSVAFLKLLRRSKRYYYRTNHFVSVSGMFYRMKRNGAGLASICILSTMVLVMISSTTCLYIGADDALRVRFPRNIEISTETSGPDEPRGVESAVQKALDDAGTRAESLLDYRYLSFSAVRSGDELLLGQGAGGRVLRVYAVPAEDYAGLSGRELILQEGEVAVYEKGAAVGGTLKIGGFTRRIAEKLDAFADVDADAMSVTDSLYVFVPSMDDMRALDDEQKDAYGENASAYHHYCGFDVPLDRPAQAELARAIRSDLEKASPGSYVAGAAESWDSFLGLYGGLVFLGLLLGLTFILAAALIMYYKQITEGYEDNARFDILKKVGMTGREIRKTINSQVLTVFALPLAAAAVHMAFAFPMVAKLLKVLNLTNVPLFFAVTAVTILVFAILYVAAYLVTSRAYLAIVGGANGRARA